MKKLYQIIPLTLILFSLGGCGLANNLATTGHMLKSDFTPHFHKVKRSGTNSFPENGMGVVSLNFTTGYESALTSGVDTLWRKKNDDGTFSGTIALTYGNPFKRGRIESMLEPGIYFLDGIDFAKEGYSLVREGSLLDFLSRKQHGWDASKNEPLWFSFVVTKGQELVVPDVTVSARCKSGNSCSGDNFAIGMKMENSDSPKAKFYKIGYKIEK